MSYQIEGIVKKKYTIMNLTISLAKKKWLLEWGSSKINAISSF